MADELCDSEAQSAGLPGTYKAWLSTANGAPATSFARGQRPYMLPDDVTQIASGWADLTDGSIGHAIDQRANQSVASSNLIYTGVATDGSATGADCQTYSSLIPTDTTTTGQSGQSVAGWTDTMTFGCDGGGAWVYCFAQPE